MASDKRSVARKTDNNDAKIALGERLRAARERTGMDQYPFAMEIGKRPEQVSRWERGEQMPGADIVGAWARVTGCDGDWILTGRGQLRLVTSTPVEEEGLSMVDQAIRYIFGAVQPAPELDARIRARALATGFNTDRDRDMLASLVKREREAWEAEQRGAVPRTTEGKPVQAKQPREGAMPLAPAKGKRKG